MFSCTYEPRYGDFKDFELIKPGAVLDFVQDAAIRDSDSCGYGLSDLRAMNRAWLLQGMNFYFSKPVKATCTVEICTAVKRMRGATSERGSIIKQNGESVGKVIANWFIFDSVKMKPCRISPEISAAYEPYDFNDDFYTYQKPELYEFDGGSYSVRVSNKDIDTNKHLNNQRGADILMDALPFDFYFNSINLLYKKPAYLGDELDVCIKEIENGYYVHLQTKERELCVAGTFVNV